MNVKNPSVLKWYEYLLRIIPVFAIFMFDFVSYMVWGKIVDQYRLSELTKAICAHMSTIFVWIVGGVLILMLFKKKCGIDLLQSQSRPAKRGVILSIICVVVMTVFLYAVSGGVKPVLEYQSAIRRLGSLGWIDFILQNIYYVFEMFMALMMCALGQEAGEALTTRKKVPWGGLVLGIAWGLPHILSKNFVVGLMSVAIGIILGLPYVLLNKNAKLSWIFMFLMFVL